MWEVKGNVKGGAIMQHSQSKRWIGVYDGCYVDHASLTSGDFTANMRLFIEKWGVDNHGMSREQSQFKYLFP